MNATRLAWRLVPVAGVTCGVAAALNAARLIDPKVAGIAAGIVAGLWALAAFAAVLTDRPVRR